MNLLRRARRRRTFTMFPRHPRARRCKINYPKVAPRNNPYGTAGKPKCTRCRKRKCEYEAPGGPCGFCLKLGLNCSLSTTRPGGQENVNVSSLNEKDIAAAFIHNHGRGLEQVHRRLLNPSEILKPPFEAPINISPSDSEIVTNDLVRMLTKRYPSMGPEAILKEVRNVVTAFGFEIEAPLSTSSPHSTTTPATSPELIPCDYDIMD